MNGCIEWVWSTFKQLLRMFDIRNEAELQATLELLRDTYQSASSASVAQRAYAHQSLRPSKLGIFRENASQGAEGRRGDDNHPRVDNLIANDRTATVRESARPNNENPPEVAKKFATQRCENAHETHGTHRKLQLSERNSSSRNLMLMLSDSGRHTLDLYL